MPSLSFLTSATKGSVGSSWESSQTVVSSSSHDQIQSSSKAKAKYECKDAEKHPERSKATAKSKGKSKRRRERPKPKQPCPHGRTAPDQPCPACADLDAAHVDSTYSINFWAQDATTPGPSFCHNNADESIAAHRQMNRDHCNAVHWQLDNDDTSGSININLHYDQHISFSNDHPAMTDNTW